MTVRTPNYLYQNKVDTTLGQKEQNYGEVGTHSADDRTAPVLDTEAISAAIDQIHPGQTVVCRDGPAGHIVATMRSPTGRLQQIAVRRRWWGRMVNVPAALIETVEHMCVHLTVVRRELKDLPE